ncbi:MAG: hypothetical protein WD118_01650 [Phycisphaeraceae bacterium]
MELATQTSCTLGRKAMLLTDEGIEHIAAAVAKAATSTNCPKPQPPWASERRVRSIVLA